MSSLERIQLGLFCHEDEIFVCLGWIDVTYMHPSGSSGIGASNRTFGFGQKSGEGLTLIQGKRRIPLDISSMYDPSFGQIERRQFRVQQVNARRLILTGTFSDGAGSYVAEWLVVDGASVRTLLSNDPSTVRDKLLR